MLFQMPTQFLMLKKVSFKLSLHNYRFMLIAVFMDLKVCVPYQLRLNSNSENKLTVHH